MPPEKIKTTVVDLITFKWMLGQTSAVKLLLARFKLSEYSQQEVFFQANPWRAFAEQNGWLNWIKWMTDHREWLNTNENFRAHFVLFWGLTGWIGLCYWSANVISCYNFSEYLSIFRFKNYLKKNGSYRTFH